MNCQALCFLLALGFHACVCCLFLFYVNYFGWAAIGAIDIIDGVLSFVVFCNSNSIACLYNYANTILFAFLVNLWVGYLA